MVKWQPAYRFQRERTKVSIELLEATVKAISLHIPWLKKNKKHAYPPTSKKTWASSPTVTWCGHRTLLLTFALGAEGAAWLASIPAVTLFLPSAGTTRAVTDTQQGSWLSKCLRADREAASPRHTPSGHTRRGLGCRIYLYPLPTERKINGTLQELQQAPSQTHHGAALGLVITSKDVKYHRQRC